MSIIIFPVLKRERKILVLIRSSDGRRQKVEICQGTSPHKGLNVFEPSGENWLSYESLTLQMGSQF